MMNKIVFILLFFMLLGSGNVQAITDPTGGQVNDTINKKIEGKKEGYWIIWAHMRNLPDFKPDDKVEEGIYKTNRKVGMWKKYYSNGELKSEIEFSNGRARGEFTTYYPNGQVEEKGSWKGRAYTKEFTRWHENGNLAQEKFFNDAGKTEGTVKYYHSNGQVELEFSTNNGVETGTATRYYPNGDVKEVMTYGAEGVVATREEKKRVNPAVKLEEENTKKTEPLAGEGEILVPTDIGKITDGYHKTYNKNKDILMDGEFKAGNLWNGKHYIYDENGLLERIEVYKEGKYVGNGVL